MFFDFGCICTGISLCLFSLAVSVLYDSIGVDRLAHCLRVTYSNVQLGVVAFTASISTASRGFRVT